MLDIKQSDPREEALRTATLLDALVRETQRLGERQADPALRRALLGQARRSRRDAARLRSRLRP